MTSTAPLPAAVQTALTAIARDLRHGPRENCASIPDILLYLRRQAKRVDGVREMKGSVSKPDARPAVPQAASAQRQAEAVFGGQHRKAGRVQRRSIISRKGGRVVVEVRQLEMVL